MMVRNGNTYNGLEALVDPSSETKMSYSASNYSYYSEPDENYGCGEMLCSRQTEQRSSTYIVIVK